MAKKAGEKMANVIDVAIQLKDNFSSTLQTVEKNVGQFSKTANRTGKDVKRVGKDLEGFGKSMITHVTLPTIALGTASLKSATDLEDGMAKVSTIADTSKASLASLRQGILSISNTTGIAATDLAEAEYNAISAGVDTGKSIEFLGVAAKTSKAGFADMDTTIDALTTTLNAYGMKTEDVMDISNQMLLTQDFGKTTVQEMGASLGNVIPIASQLNISTKELFASLATLTKNGIKTSEAVTGLKGAYSNILKPTAQASKLAKELGLNFSAAHLQSVGWAKFLDEIKEKTGGSAEKMAQLFGSVQGLNAVMVLTGKGSKDFSTVLGKMGDTAGLTDKKFEQLLTPTQKLKIEFNKLKNAGTEFGIQLIPLITKFTQFLSKLTDKFKNLSPAQQQTIIKFMETVAVMGPIIWLIGRMTTGVGKLIIKFGLFAGKLKIGKTLMQAIFVPGVKVALVIGGIIAAAVLLIKNFDKLKTKVSEVKTHFSGLKDVAKSLKDNLIGLKDKGVAKVEAQFNSLKDTAKTLKDNLIDLKDKAVTKTKEKFEEFKDALVDNQDAIKTTAAILGTIFGPALVKTGVQAAKSGGKIAGSFIANIIKTGKEAAISGAKIAASFVASVIKAGKEAVIAGGKIAGNFIKSIVKAGAQAAISGAKVMASFVASVIKAGKEAVIAGGKVTIQFVGSLIKASKQAVITAGTITGQLVASLVRYAAQGWKTVISIAATTGAWIAQKAAMMGSAIATGAMTIAQRALNAAMNANPIAIVIGLVVGLSTVLVILYKKCKPVRDAFNAMWGGIKHGAIVAVNGIISAINFLIKGLNKIKIPKWVPKIGGKGVNIPLIPKLAKGTMDWQGGIVQVHERGGEIIDLPQGSRVYPHDESVAMAKEQGRKESKPSILITGNSFNVREEADIDKIADALYRKIEKTSFNMI